MSLGQHVELVDRKVNTRGAEHVQVFSIESIDEHLQENIDVVKRQCKIADELYSQGKVEAAEDIWRSQLVVIESALDFYLHEIIKLGIISIYSGVWKGMKTEPYNNLSFCMKELETACHHVDDDTWLAEWIDRKYATETLMSFSGLEKVCKILGLDKQKIANVFYERQSTTKPIKKLEFHLNRMYGRRNIIAHQAGRKSATAEKITIHKNEIVEWLDKVEEILKAVSDEMKRYLIV